MTAVPRQLVVVVVFAVALGSTPASLLEGRRASQTLTDLRGVGELEELFNRDAGKIRLVLLLSPT